MYEQGDIVLVPFSFTDLSELKRRPALVVSPNWFNTTQEDVVLVAITSSFPDRLEEQLETFLSLRDISSGVIPRQSIVKVWKIFTCHKEIIVKKVASVRKNKLKEVLDKLKKFFDKEDVEK